MVYVVLRDGRTLQYNSGGAIAVEDGTITVRVNGGDNGLVARIPMDLVERAEFQAPCEILPSKRTTTRRAYPAR